MSRYLTQHCAEHGEYEAESDGDQECEECRAQGKLPYQLDAKRIATLESDVAALKAQLAQHKASLPTCEKHKPDRGARSGCVICAGHALSNALSRIDYACGEPNEMECSDYDLHQNESEVVKRVVALKAKLADSRDYIAFYDEVCRRAEQAMMKSHRLEGMHYMAMTQVKDEWDAARKEQSK